MLQLRRHLLRQLPQQLLCLQLLQNQCLPWKFGPALLQHLEFSPPGAGAGAEAPGAGALAGSLAPFVGDSSGPKALLAAICSADCDEFAAAGVRETAEVAAGVTSGVAAGVGTDAGVATGFVWFGRIAAGMGDLDGAAARVV